MREIIGFVNKPTFKVRDFFLLFCTAWLYFLLATGTVFPEFVLSYKTLASVINLAFFLFFLNYKLFRLSFIQAFFIIFPIFISFSFSLFLSNNIYFAISKIEGAVIVGTLISAGVSFVLSLSGERKFLRMFLLVSFLILLLTILYRFSLGLTERNDRFLLNGPIVFGWIMGFNFIICIHLFFSESKRFYLFLSFVFIAVVLWTQSKGPFLACLATATILILRNIKFNRFRLILSILSFSFLAYYLSGYLEFGDRYLALLRLFNNDLNESDGGSVNIRALMLNDSIRLWQENVFFGVGLGNWNEYVNTFFLATTTLTYPHNFIAESLSETGIFGFLILLTVYFFVYSKSSGFSRYILIYFSICLLFSGDASYLRFAFSIPIGFLIAGKISKLHSF